MDIDGSFKFIDILLVEDNPADIDLAREALEESKMLCKLHVVNDGEAAMQYLRRAGQYAGASRPDLVILDLNLPRKDGREVLKEIKEDDALRSIPVVVLTMSQAETDMLKAYHEHANCYIRKPLDFEQFVNVVRAIGDFWFTVVCLPKKEPANAGK